jgi:hypothetical protein
LVSSRLHEAEFDSSVIPREARVKYHAAASLAMRVDQGTNGRFDAGPGERVDENLPFPLRVEISSKMLRRATAAVAKMAANGRGTLGGGPRAPLGVLALAAVANDAGPHELAGQRAWDIDGTLCRTDDPFAAMAKAFDHQFLHR